MKQLSTYERCLIWFGNEELAMAYILRIMPEFRDGIKLKEMK